MATITKKQMEEYERLRRERDNGRILTPDGLRLICAAYENDPEKIGAHMLEMLYKYLQFYKQFPEIVRSLTAQSGEGNIVPSVTAQLLSWTHYEKLLQATDKKAREWYAKEAFEQTWSVRTLQRNISSQYYYRMLKTQDKAGVEKEMQELTNPYQNRLEFIKNPVIAEFFVMKCSVRKPCRRRTTVMIS